MLNADPHSFLYRSVAFVAGVSVLGIGAMRLLRYNDVVYANWFGQLVFAPLAILLGLFVALCAVFKPDWLDRRPAQRTPRTRRLR